ncbi:MAG: isoprenylcysteine carboxylmethyltransferase family protein [Eudoraea sp.]|nr:isoprenylcysteine carboxylmethyltransferase family protein [Eudoraea sp.]
MKLKIPPVVIFLAFALFMFLLAKLLPFGGFDFFGRQYLIVALLVIAIVISIVALLQFKGAKTTVDPTIPTKASQLVTGGIYKFSRNPMYLALLLMLLALGLQLGNAFNTLTAAFFVAYMNKFQIVPEEEILSNLFGKEYHHYCSRVRRWF